MFARIIYSEEFEFNVSFKSTQLCKKKKKKKELSTNAQLICYYITSLSYFLISE